MLIVPLMMPEVEALAHAAEVHRRVDDVRAAAARAEVRAADALHVRLRAVRARQHLPLDAELGRLVRRHLDDQRLDEHLRAPRVEPLDHRAQVVVDRLGRHDDQRVVRGVGLDHRAARGECRRRAGRAARRRAGSSRPTMPRAPSSRSFGSTPASPRATAAVVGAAAGAAPALAAIESAQRLGDVRRLRRSSGRR